MIDANDMTQIQSMIQSAIRQENASSRFGLNAIPFHTHDNVDSPAVVPSVITFAGSISYDGVTGNAVVYLLPAGWTATRLGTGAYTITHNLGSFYYAVAALSTNPVFVSPGQPVYCFQSTNFLNSFNLYSFDGASRTALDTPFQFVLTFVANRHLPPTYYGLAVGTAVAGQATP